MNKWKTHYLKNGVLLSTLEYIREHSSFFGYYGVSPQNNHGDFLFCETDSKCIRGCLISSLKIFKGNNTNASISFIDSTFAWNWQQGCLLQWINNSKSKIIYNYYDKDKDEYFAKLIDLSTGVSKIFSKPIYSVSRNGDFALTLNFQRLAELRPDYGYFRKKKDSDFSLDSDGIWIINLITNKSKLILSLNQIIEFQFDSSMEHAVHKVNHIQISPDSKRFLFFHIWRDGKKRYTRLLTSDIRGDSLFYLTGNSFVSHCCWKSNNEIIAFCEDNHDNKKKYMLFIDLKHIYSPIDENKLNYGDGHPSVSPDGNWLLIDTYPDTKTRMSSLIMYNFESKRTVKLGEFFNPWKFVGEMRCDLHPRWCYDQNYISIDSVFTGRRKQYLLNIEQIIQ